MNLKESLLNLKERIMSGKKDNDYSTTELVSAKEQSLIDLDNKVDAFIEWYFNMMIKDIYMPIGEFERPKIMRDLIEKMAIWYELRYPIKKIDELMPCGMYYETNVNKTMFVNNAYIQDLVNDKSEINELEWSDFYNYDVFYESLSFEEKEYLKKPKKDSYNLNYQYEEMLNCVMYRIISRGGYRIGPRRGFLFAKEFNRNIDIPMMYAEYEYDSGLRLFINEYLKAGGSKDLKCYIGYYNRISKDATLKTISVADLLLKQRYSKELIYTPEERKYASLFLGILSRYIEKEEVKEADNKVKQLLSKNID